MNWPLFSIVYSMAATVITGLFIIGVLVAGYDGIGHMQIAVVAGLVASIPAGIFFTKKIGSITGNEDVYRL